MLTELLHRMHILVDNIRARYAGNRILNRIRQIRCTHSQIGGCNGADGPKDKQDVELFVSDSLTCQTATAKGVSALYSAVVMGKPITRDVVSAVSAAGRSAGRHFK